MADIKCDRGNAVEANYKKGTVKKLGLLMPPAVMRCDEWRWISLAREWGAFPLIFYASGDALRRIAAITCSVHMHAKKVIYETRSTAQHNLGSPI